MTSPLGRRFFSRPAEEVARALLGAKLVNGRRLGIVVETEAYLGPDDGASHARFTSSSRNAVMYAVGGTAYVYLCYGVHQLFNVVTGREGEPQAVLLRALSDPLDASSRRMSGPGKLTRALGIGPQHNGVDLTRGKLGFVRGRAVPSEMIEITPRVGVDYAGDWANAPLRFCIRDHAAVSRA